MGLKRIALFGLMVALLLALPSFASYYDYYGGSSSYDYSYQKDYDYIRVKESERTNHQVNDYDYGHDCDYYGDCWDGYRNSGRRARGNFNYFRSREFEFGHYSESVSVHSSSCGNYIYSYHYNYPYNYHHNYPDYGYGRRYGYDEYPDYPEFWYE